MKIKVSGMTCPHCEMTVRKALSNVEGVTRVVTVDRILSEAIVEGNPELSALIDAVKKSGYQAEFVQ